MERTLCRVCSNMAETVNRTCEPCRKEYELVRSHIDRYPSANVMEISSTLGITVRKIMKFVEEGRFILVEAKK